MMDACRDAGERNIGLEIMWHAGKSCILNARTHILTNKVMNVIHKIDGSNREMGMATHSSILAWRVPWTVWCYSPRGHRVGHD